jgi:hypothetical protein
MKARKILIVATVCTAPAVSVGLLGGTTSCGSTTVVQAAAPPTTSDAADGNTNVVNNDTPVQPCSTANNALTVAFAPMYSANDGPASAGGHLFQVPAIVVGVRGSVITWGSSDPTKVNLAPDTVLGGIIITTSASGTVTITASAGSTGELCGSSVLTITANTPGDWAVGNARYNDGVSVHLVRGQPSDPETDGGGPACTNCHGPTATDQRYKTVAHTPEQAGGFSDQELITIFTQGIVPDGGYFDPSIVSYQQWQQFHKWTDMDQSQQTGMIAYLRSLTPTVQTGSSNFGGLFDGGMRPPRDAGGGG